LSTKCNIEIQIDQSHLDNWALLDITTCTIISVVLGFSMLNKTKTKITACKLLKLKLKFRPKNLPKLELKLKVVACYILPMY